MLISPTISFQFPFLDRNNHNTKGHQQQYWIIVKKFSSNAAVCATQGFGVISDTTNIQQSTSYVDHDRRTVTDGTLVSAVSMVTSHSYTEMVKIWPLTNSKPITIKLCRIFTSTRQTRNPKSAEISCKRASGQYVKYKAWSFLFKKNFPWTSLL